MGKNIFGFATTGFNLDRSALVDKSKVASSSKYGKTELQRAHPGWNVRKNIFRPIGGQALMIALKTPKN